MYKLHIRSCPHVTRTVSPTSMLSRAHTKADKNRQRKLFLPLSKLSSSTRGVFSRSQYPQLGLPVAKEHAHVESGCELKHVHFREETWCVILVDIFHLSKLQGEKFFILVACYISGEAAGEFWNWSLLSERGNNVNIIWNVIASNTLKKYFGFQGAGALWSTQLHEKSDGMESVGKMFKRPNSRPNSYAAPAETLGPQTRPDRSSAAKPDKDIEMSVGFAPATPSMEPRRFRKFSQFSMLSDASDQGDVPVDSNSNAVKTKSRSLLQQVGWPVVTQYSHNVARCFVSWHAMMFT